MEKFKEIFEKYRVYLTRPRIEIATVLLIAICVVSVFLLNTPKKGVLTLDNGVKLKRYRRTDLLDQQILFLIRDVDMMDSLRHFR